MIGFIDTLILHLKNLQEYLIQRSLPKGETAKEWARKQNKTSPEDLFNGS